jgi:carbon-monoxide dehydrogenase large subunit
MVEVEVDPETGHVEILRYLVVEDAGVLVNPAIVDGQVHGGVAQGVANALLEELVYDDQGTLLTTSFLDYLPPTAAEIPHIEIAHRSSISDATLTGAKGVGEGGTIGAPAAILGAISDALDHLGIRVVQMPATPSRIRELIRNAQEDV